MSRKLKAAVAQLGPIHLADARPAVVKRLTALMREAHAAGARFVVFPELDFTTCFPRYWMTDQAEIDRFFEREMPGPETRPLFDLAAELEVGFYLGYAELTQEKGEPRHYNTSILIDTDGGSSGAIARSTCRGIPSICPTRRSSISKNVISMSATRASGCGAPSAPLSACASATTGAGPRRSASWGCRASRSSRSVTTRRPRTFTIPSPCISACFITS